MIFADTAGIGLLLHSYPPELVDEAVASCGRTEQRRRLLSARLMVYFVLAMALFSPAPYLDVMSRLTRGIRRGGLWGDEQLPSAERLPSKASIFQARERLGSAPLRELVRSAVQPIETPDIPHAHRWGEQLMLLQEQTVELPKGTDLGPRLKVVGLVEGGSRAIVNVVLGGDGTERALLRSVPPGTLLMVAGRPLTDDLLRAVAAVRAEVAWLPPAGWRRLEPHRWLPDGSFLTVMGGRQLRVVGSGLVTTALDHELAPAAELLALDSATAGEREVLRGVLLGSDRKKGPLTSKTAEGIRQEVYGRLLVHHALRRMPECLT
ncbi:transposase domain-containing protein [Kitasatospora sp. GP82]|uniref:transposase domain-containing protein n=1 Tax=Kitasatospora sp. GP82 TaxID=3035089 RepID=UPI0024747976|nr:transposase domain-containing protein [Kitasatospora sp. GP82]MDH6128061.1 hypothetical protein [Kitasatospora sp. GP82]